MKRPRLISHIEVTEGPLVLGDAGSERELTAASLSHADIVGIVSRLDGTSSLQEILGDQPPASRSAAAEFLEALDAAGVIDDLEPASYFSGGEAILEIEELLHEHCAATIYTNAFWRKCLSVRGPGDLSQKLATGMVIENWHFLFRESYFDAPVLSYVPNTSVRLLLNQFFSEEYGHDELLMGSLNAVGISRSDMHDAIPLPETMALCNALAFWAHTDPLFFFATLGLLEGQGMKHDSFIEACQRAELPDDFVEPLRKHANINLGAAHGNLTRAIFRQLSALDAETISRLKRQVPLFVGLYDAFYMAVWRHYTSSEPLLRRVSEL